MPWLICSVVLAQSSAKVVKVSHALWPKQVELGRSFQVEISIDIERGFHINSDRPGDKYLKATSLKLEPLPGLSFGRVIYPKAVSKSFKFSKKPLSVYEGRPVIRFSARSLDSLSVGKHAIKAKLTVQACNDEICLMPSTIDIEIPFEVVPAKSTR
jgi:thiol:disulfide interchange protein DsbD